MEQTSVNKEYLENMMTEFAKLRVITSVEYLHEVFSRSCEPKRYDGGWGGCFPALDFYIHELCLSESGERFRQKELLEEREEEAERRIEELNNRVYELECDKRRLMEEVSSLSEKRG